jgi:hypothetical protein
VHAGPLSLALSIEVLIALAFGLPVVVLVEVYWRVMLPCQCWVRICPTGPCLITPVVELLEFNCLMSIGSGVSDTKDGKHKHSIHIRLPPITRPNLQTR